MPDVIVETTASQLAHERAYLRVRQRMALAALVAAGAAVLVALVLLLGVLWLILSTPKATGFDADGVRCYRAVTMSCIKTAEPPR